MHTLLLADDSVTIQRVIELIFADQGVDVVAVGDGDAAIRHVDAAPPDIVLADIGMPGRDGYEVARYVKHNPRLAHIPVVLLAGAFDSVDQDRARAAGCDGILAKPFEPQLVISRVQELLATPHRAATPALDDGLVALLEVQSASAPGIGDDDAAGDEVPARAHELDTYFDQLDAAFADRLNAGAANLPSPATPPEDAERSAADRSGMPTSSALADTFAALLAADQVERPAGPIPTAPSPTTDEIVEQVSRRILAQLTDRVVRETVADFVSVIAERLVREEIARIKASIK